MSFSTDLLQQAAELLRKEAKRPRQASLRRAVSAAYYALFHLLTDEAAKLLVSGPQRAVLRQCLRRAFAHGAMKTVSNDFGRGVPSRQFLPALAGAAVPGALRQVATAFVGLQQARHEADYDHLRTYTKAEAVDVVQQAHGAVAAWDTVRGSIAADAYLVALLAQGAMRG